MSISGLFEDKYACVPRTYKVPGRVNLIGEHTDYNSGFVFPGATNLSLDFALSKSTTKNYSFYSLAFEEEDTCDSEGKGCLKKWSVFFSNVIKLMGQNNYNIGPANCLFGGNLPMGAGMSSSSSLTCGFIFALNDLYSLRMSAMEMTRMASQAEHQSGLLGGMMDQFTIFFGKKNQLLLIDCQDMSYEPIDFENDESEILIVESRVSHDLINSDYNARRLECESGIKILQKTSPDINGVRDLTFNHLKTVGFPDLLKDRLGYILEENQRVLRSKDAILSRDWKKLGDILVEGHMGLKDKYEVTCEQTDFMVDWLVKEKEVFGARQMGGGFGGSVICLINRGSHHFRNRLASEYFKRFGLRPLFHIVRLSDGVHRIH